MTSKKEGFPPIIPASEIGDSLAEGRRENSRRSGGVILHDVNFYGDRILVVERHGGLFVPMKPLCEIMELSWDAQRQLIQRDPVLSSVACMIHATGKDNKSYRMLVIPFEYLNGWLFKIDVSRYEGGRREKLIRYQSQCYQALFRYFFASDRLGSYDPELTKICKNIERRLAGIGSALQSLSHRIESLEDSVDKLRGIRDPSGPEARFVKEMCDLNQGRKTPKDELYRVYVGFCELYTYKPECKNHFFRKLYQVSDILKSSGMTVRGKRIPAVAGISFKEKNLPEL